MYAPTRARKQQKIQTGKTTWSAEEDDLLRALVSDTPPNSWSAIAKYFPTKTAPQISGRWEKVLNPSLVKGSWTKEEDEVILNFVHKNGLKDWAKLALLLAGRTGKQCRERFKNHLDPGVLRIAWTAEEDQQLINLQARFGNQWTRIASFFEGRTDNCIKNRWNSTLKKRIHRLQSGEPLVQKRGRKPKELRARHHEVIEQYDNVLSSPVHDAQTQTVVPLAVEFSLFITRRRQSDTKIPTLAENRLNFQRILRSLERDEML
jgi:hypothetical protein